MRFVPLRKIRRTGKKSFIYLSSYIAFLISKPSITYEDSRKYTDISRDRLRTTVLFKAFFFIRNQKFKSNIIAHK